MHVLAKHIRGDLHAHQIKEQCRYENKRPEAEHVSVYPIINVGKTCAYWTLIWYRRLPML